MKADPVSPQGRHTVTVGDLALSIETPSNLDALLDRTAAENPQAVDAIPYYAILWPAAHGLARHLWDHRADLPGKRIIELGCGLGLPSILAAKLGAQVTSTDFHPGTGEWLLRNAALNRAELDYQSLDWEAYLDARPATADARYLPPDARSLAVSPVLGSPQTFSRCPHPGPAPCDLVIGSDLVYERRHIPALVCAIGALCAPQGHAVVSDPGRDNLSLFVSTMEKSGWRLMLEAEDDIYVCRFDRG